MGLFGGSSKKSSTTTNQTDRRQVIGERSTSSGMDNIRVGSKGQLTTNTINNVLDGGAWDLVDGVVRNTVGAVGDANARSLAFADGAMSQAMDLANASTTGALSRALGFADGAMSQTLDLAYDSTSGALSRSLGFADGALSQVLGVVNDAMSTVRGGLATAADAAAASAGMAKDAYADAKGRGAMTDYLLLAAVVVMGIVAMRARA